MSAGIGRTRSVARCADCAHARVIPGDSDDPHWTCRQDRVRDHRGKFGAGRPVYIHSTLGGTHSPLGEMLTASLNHTRLCRDYESMD